MGQAARQSRAVSVGDVPLGGGAPVSVQSMLTTPVDRLDEALGETEALRLAGCEIIRLALPSSSFVKPLAAFVRRSPLPVVADVHYDCRLAVAAVGEAGVQKVRINPGNLKNPELLPDLVKAASARRVPVRVGLNSGSVAPRSKGLPADVHPELLLVEATISAVRRLEDLGFGDIVVSAKSPDVRTTLDVYRCLAEAVPYPLHLGVTAAGGVRAATVKHALAFGVLLSEGIGDTVRVSIASDPVEEVRVAWSILRALGLRKRGAEVIACPTCARTTVDIAAKVIQVEEALGRLHMEVGEKGWPDGIRTVAVMGCDVNGPGEAAASDIGLAFGGRQAVLFRRGEPVGRPAAEDAVDALLDAVRATLGKG